MSHERLNALSLMAMKSNLVRSLDFQSVIKRLTKARKAKLYAQFLQYAVSTDLTNPFPTVSTDAAANPQAEFRYFYTVARKLMDEYYPEQTITLIAGIHHTSHQS